MKNAGRTSKWRTVAGLALFMSVWCAAPVAPAQVTTLAITEVMSEAAIRHGTNIVGRGSDYFELTNFGTNWLDLTGFSFTDGTMQLVKPRSCFDGLILGPGESVIFFRTNNSIRTEQLFREWWGPCLRPEVKLRGFEAPGFNPASDGVRLLDRNDQVLDQVYFGSARSGVSFCYGTNCGDLAYSVLGSCGGCQAATADDIGSPGTTCGPVPLRITAQPVSLSNLCYGSDAVFCVSACGLPRPKYQWLSNGVPILGANAAYLTITNAPKASEAEYRVLVTNGLEVLLSGPAYLTVETNPTPPRLLALMPDVERFAGEKVTLSPQVCAFPPPQFQWYSNNMVHTNYTIRTNFASIVSATNRTLVVDSATVSKGTRYWVGITNALGFTNATNLVLIHPLPTLEITQVMPAPATNGVCANHMNWFQLTVRGSNSVWLHMLKHLDQPSPLQAKPITNRVELLPGESAIFVEEMTREQFHEWWGASNLPPSLTVVTWVGYGLNAWSDTIHVWSAAATGSEDAYFAAVTWASRTVPPNGPTCPDWCDPDLTGQPLYGHALFFVKNDECAEQGRVIRENQNGGFRAAQCTNDLGAPGFAGNPVFLTVRTNWLADEMHIRVVPGKTYLLEGKTNHLTNAWTVLGTYLAPTPILLVTNIPNPGTSNRFYRLRQLP